MEKRHFEQAKIWFDGANYIANSDKEGSDKYAVAVAMTVHSIIKANDALTFKFLHSTARRHDEARRLFEDLIKQNFVKSEYADYKQIIQEAIDNKAKSEYRGAYFSKADFESLKRKAEKFLKMAGEIIK
ncbi:MAG: hypothetical protein AABX39_03210 [Nanoarchaeota archaeon]